ncbi:NAD(P)H-dependent oxidoreductase [Lonepinella sp. BR2930]|uniref:NAD(P)H-dependent oxidoreductase n=1 Tax=Lonepinella sp. BR2930 TaxID=3434554 RepID=UPI003F6DBC45
MYYNQLFNFSAHSDIKIAILGANGGFGYSLLAQCALIPQIKVSVVCDIHVLDTENILKELGWPREQIKICYTLEEIEQIIAENGTAIINNPDLLPFSPVDMLIESTGNPELGAKIAERSLINKQHVGMVSKETESVVGPYLAKVASQNGVTYTTVDGDQPSNLIHLYSWMKNLGLQIIAAGKSSEYDYIWDPQQNSITYLNEKVDVPDFEILWALSDNLAETLAKRKQRLSALPQYATPDYCEMNVVANNLALQTDKEELHYPICRINELADIFIPKADGGILENNNVVEVFNCLRKQDELSFAGGEFVIVKCHNQQVWQTLKEKGHIVSRHNKYAAIILPYHLMGVESPISIFSAVLHNRASGNPKQQQHTIMTGRAERDFKKGEILNMGGHHHVIQDVRPLLVNVNGSNRQEMIPFYLMSNKKLLNDVSKGSYFKLSDFELQDSDLYRMYKAIICD